jgi:hypothetical protein
VCDCGQTIVVEVDDLMNNSKRHCGCRHGKSARLPSGSNKYRRQLTRSAGLNTHDNAILLKMVKKVAALWGPLTIVKLTSVHEFGREERQANNTRTISIEDVASGKKIEVTARSYGRALSKIKERVT